MKKEYIEAELELIRLEAIDVITESDPNGDNGDVNDNPNW